MLFLVWLKQNDNKSYKEIKKVTCIKSFYYIVDVKKYNYVTVTNVWKS